MFKYALLDYTPKRYLRKASFDTQETDRLILNFKRGRNYAGRTVAKMITRSLSLMDLSDTSIVCVPASSEHLNKLRYKNFVAMLCKSLGAVNAFDKVRVVGKRDRIHLRTCDRKDNIEIDKTYFAGRKVLVFDDIYTTGKSSDLFIKKMEEVGAIVVMALFLAKTRSYYKPQ